MFKRPVALGGVVSLVAALALTAPVGAQAPSTGSNQGPDGIEVYVGQVQVEQLANFRLLGLDFEDVATGPTKDGKVDVEAILSQKQAKRLAKEGVGLSIKQVGGKPASQVLRQQAAAGQTVYRSY